MSSINPLETIEDVYNSIAHDFDKTRYSVWRGVKTFLDSLQKGCLVGDICCGNGKNMMYRKDLCYKGIDICEEFVKICQQKGLDVEKGDVLNLPIKDETFDNTLCIAAIHHLKTRDDRIKGIRELLRVTKKHGKILIYVWAYEQPNLEGGKIAKRTFEVGDNNVSFKTKENKIVHRFYHVYYKGELESEIRMIKNMDYILERVYYELGNWCAVITKL